jgi:hypothetical protein
MANISRDSFDESKAYDKVILQQGMPVTDYDINEMQDIQRTKLKNIVSELFGDGAIADGYKIVKTAALTVQITAGTIYLKGYRVRLANNTSTTIPSANGTYKVYLAVSEQEIDSVADPSIKHVKLSLEPTRRIKIVADVLVGASVPVDTATFKYYELATVVVSSANITTVTDSRSIKVTFEGAGFSVKGGATLGDDASDIIDIQGTIKNTSSNNGGKVQVDDHLNVTGDFTVAGKVTSAGIVVQTGKLYEVSRLPLYGVAGDLQYQSDATAFEDVTNTLYGLFDIGTANSALPAIPSGATRKYKLRIAYASSGGTVTIRLVSGATTKDFNLPSVVTALDGSRIYTETAEFTQANIAGDWKVQAKITSGNTMAVMWVELIAYDVY